MSVIDCLSEYVELCRRIGPWMDWIQGGGGNFSLKRGNEILVKRSGARIAETTVTSGWVLCSVEKLLQCIAEDNENAEGALLQGDGKPSIEAFFHALPGRIVVHCHPSPLLGRLCSSVPLEHDGCRWIPYIKPGVQLAKQVLANFDSTIQIYFLQNHGIILIGDTIDDILTKMTWVADTFFPATERITHISMVSRIYSHLKTVYNSDKIIKSWKTSFQWMDRLFLPYTPDGIVFLQQGAIVVEDNGAEIEAQIDRYIQRYNNAPTVLFCQGTLYLIAPSYSQTFDILEIFLGYMMIPAGCLSLTPSQVEEITGWDKEKARKQGSTE